jgi:hypothetical protein
MLAKDAAGVPASDPSVHDLVAELRKTPGLLYTDEPGFAHDFKPPSWKPLLWSAAGLAPLALSAGGLAALGLNPGANASAASTAKKKKKPARPKLEKQADWRELLYKIRSQLPGIHTPDIAAGSLLGAGGGLVYDLLRGQSPDEQRQVPRWRTRLRRALTGALVGGTAANLVGDRARRYLSNTLLPFGYDGKNLSNVKPDSWRKIWRAGILDQPSYDPKTLKEYAGHRSAALGARREIMRRTFGVHADHPVRDWWQRNQDSTYSLNERNPNYLKRMRELFGPSNRVTWLTHSLPLLQDPTSLLQSLNTQNLKHMGRDDQFDFFGTSQLMGAQQIPHKLVGDTLHGRVLDRFDVTPGPQERKHLKSWLAAKLLPTAVHRQWLQSKLPFDRKVEGMIGTNYHYVEDNTTNDQLGKTVAGRWVWDNILSKEKPWISQKFKAEKLPDNQPVYSDGSEYYDGEDGYIPANWQFSFLRENNTPALKLDTTAKLKEWVEAPPPDNELSMDGLNQ